ncbi:hypothetical protein FOA52_008506 [Chlamydomonas sp. UWO 241]|nr:hypothetical protein FOA52_008506 [Chlamydomonas sp. UWO 241]
MQQQPVPEEEPVTALDDVVRELWQCLDKQVIRALRSCCTPLRDAVDAQISGLDGPINEDAPVLSTAACARLCGVHTMTLRSMPCLRGMQPRLVAPHPQPHSFPRLTSLRLLIEKEGAAAIEAAADYEAITKTAPWLTQLSLELPGDATALPQQVASLLSACSKLEDLTLRAYDVPGAYMPRVSSLVDVDALAAGTQLLRLQLPSCSSLLNLAPLRGLVNLQSLDISGCSKLSDLTPLGALVSLQGLNMRGFRKVSDLAPLRALLCLQSLNISSCWGVSDLATLAALVNLQCLQVSYCPNVSDLAPLGALLSLQSLDITACRNVFDLAPLVALLSLHHLDISDCSNVSDLAPLGALLNL